MATQINGLSLFSGLGMLDEGIRAAFEFLGFAYRVRCCVEREVYPAAALVARMAESSLDQAHIWDRLETFDARPARGRLDIVSASPPCPSFSVAGEGNGNDDPRAWGTDFDRHDRTTWGPIPHILRIVAECQPALVLFENVPPWVRGGWFRPVGEELCRLGYSICEPKFVTAKSVGANHRRERVFVLAYAARWRERIRQRFSDAIGARGESGTEGHGEGLDNAGSIRPSEQGKSETRQSEQQPWRPVESCGRHSGLDNAGSTQRTAAERRPLDTGRESTEGCSGLVNAELDGGRLDQQGRGAEVGETASGGSSELDDASRSGWRSRTQRRRVREASAELAESAIGGQRELRQPPQRNGQPDGSYEGLADTSGPGQQVSGRQPSHTQSQFEAAERSCESIFAYGRNDPRWRDILEQQPHLSPAVESGFRVLVDGHPFLVDAAWSHAVRAVGNSVVPLCGAAAFIESVREIVT